MKRERLVNFLASLLIAAVVGLFVGLWGGPAWAMGGFATLAYLVVLR
jgi:hypothetical protein